MGNLAFKHRAHIANIDPRLAEQLELIINGMNKIAADTVSDPTGETQPPSQPSALSVLASSGIFDVQIQDNNPVNRGISYFLEYSTTANFTNPIPVFLGPSRNWRSTLGNQTLYWRCYSQYPTSTPSAWTYFGPSTAPTAVVGGGSAGPTPQPSTGSGTGKGDGSDGGGGFGRRRVRNVPILRGKGVDI